MKNFEIRGKFEKKGNNNEPIMKQKHREVHTKRGWIFFSLIKYELLINRKIIGTVINKKSEYGARIKNRVNNDKAIKIYCFLIKLTTKITESVIASISFEGKKIHDIKNGKKNRI